MSGLLVLHMVEVRVELSRQNYLKGSIFTVIPTWVYLVGYNTYLILVTPFFIASQAWTFSILPLVIGPMIPNDDLHWDCYLLLIQIIQYSTATVISLSSSVYLSTLIDQHHQIFVQCYPGVKLTPKCTIWYISTANHHVRKLLLLSCIMY